MTDKVTFKPGGLVETRDALRAKTLELKDQLDKLTVQLTKAHHDYAYCTAEFLGARDSVDAAWRNMRFAESYFRD